jgi:hypothetical protein
MEQDYARIERGIVVNIERWADSTATDPALVLSHGLAHIGLGYDPDRGYEQPATPELDPDGIPILNDALEVVWKPTEWIRED